MVVAAFFLIFKAGGFDAAADNGVYRQQHLESGVIRMTANMPHEISGVLH